jgi:hypothetical protein
MAKKRLCAALFSGCQNLRAAAAAARNMSAFFAGADLLLVASLYSRFFSVRNIAINFCRTVFVAYENIEFHQD